MLRTFLACVALAVALSSVGESAVAQSARATPKGTIRARRGATATPTALPPTPTEAVPATVPAEATPEVATPAAAALDREVAALRERLASLEASMERSGPGAPAEPPPVVVPAVVEPPASLDVGPSLALAGVGFVIGFLFGTFYGQRQERNRRMRVRF